MKYPILELRGKRTSGGIIRYQDKFGDYKYVLVKGRRHSKWSFPKGHIEPRENPFECAMREIKEETGIDCLPEPITCCQVGFGIYYFFDIDNEYPLSPEDTQEIIDSKWVSIEEMKTLELNTDAKSYLKLLI